jgi:hypothetical protein
MTVDGGVLLYGVGGSDPTRPDQLMPFQLAGAAERIDQVAQAGIAEPPTIEIHDIPAPDQDGRGYLVVLIPASPRAPHMVTIEGDNRYYGRGATGNRILPEGDVARLYERRERWEVNREEWLAEILRDFPFEYDQPMEVVGPMVVAARPVVGSTDVLRRAAGDGEIDQLVRRQLPQHALASDIYPDQGTAGLEAVFDLTRRGADAWVVNRERDLTSPYQARLEVHADGQLVYWHSPVVSGASRRGQSEQILRMERSVTRAVHQPIAVAGWLYARAGYAGAVDLAVRIPSAALREAVFLLTGEGNLVKPRYGAIESGLRGGDMSGRSKGGLVHGTSRRH